MSIILGIDPGSRITGYGVIRQTGRQLTYLGSGCIRTNTTELPARLKLIYAGVCEIITQFSPDFFAIEQVFMAKNADSALKLGQARGATDGGGHRQRREKSGAAHGATPAEAAPKPAGGCRRCPGDSHHSLSRGPKRGAHE